MNRITARSNDAVDVAPPARCAETAEQWRFLAGLYAEEMHLFNFPSRRGTFAVESKNGEVVLCLYNNNPWPDFAEGRSALRDEETSRLRTWLAEHGLAEVAYATYPKTGADRGYSFAMIIDCPESMVDELRHQVSELAGWAFDEGIKTLARPNSPASQQASEQDNRSCS